MLGSTFQIRINSKKKFSHSLILEIFFADSNKRKRGVPLGAPLSVVSIVSALFSFRVC